MKTGAELNPSLQRKELNRCQGRPSSLMCHCTEAAVKGESALIKGRTVKASLSFNCLIFEDFNKCLSPHLY